jgi:hypothetical protein
MGRFTLHKRIRRKRSMPSRFLVRYGLSRCCRSFAEGRGGGIVEGNPVGSRHYGGGRTVLLTRLCTALHPMQMAMAEMDHDMALIERRALTIHPSSPFLATLRASFQSDA